MSTLAVVMLPLAIFGTQMALGYWDNAKPYRELYRVQTGRFYSLAILPGWQRQELVILVSALAQIFSNFALVALASSAFFFCARRLSVRP